MWYWFFTKLFWFQRNIRRWWLWRQTHTYTFAGASFNFLPVHGQHAVTMVLVMWRCDTTEPRLYFRWEIFQFSMRWPLPRSHCIVAVSGKISVRYATLVRACAPHVTVNECVCVPSHCRPANDGWCIRFRSLLSFLFHQIYLRFDRNYVEKIFSARFRDIFFACRWEIGGSLTYLFEKIRLKLLFFLFCSPFHLLLRTVVAVWRWRWRSLCFMMNEWKSLGRQPKRKTFLCWAVTCAH